MFRPDPDEWRMGTFHTMLPPHFLGGVAPSRYEVALAAYLEIQAAQREATADQQPNPQITKRFWRVLSQAPRHLAGLVWQHGRRAA